MSKYIRDGKYSIDEILEQVDITNRSQPFGIFGGSKMFLTSSRYRNFKKNGITCKKCGLVGKFFGKEMDAVQSSSGCEKWHFNLYAIRKDGSEVLMTKDHIVPKAKGGINHIDNYQTMCVKCNRKKGDKCDE